MSTQRRENGKPQATKTHRSGRRDRRRRDSTEFAGGLGSIWPIFLAWFARAIATVGTAPPQKAIRLNAEWLATKSLQSDYRTIQLVRQAFSRPSRSSPPPQAGLSATTGSSATRRLSPRFTPIPSVIELLHPFRPQHPAGKCRWTERYDGKRDLYFQYAA
jgi:hypothetical protein